LSAWLRQREVERIGIEASGGYKQAVILSWADGFVVIVFQPVQVRAYAKFVLQHAKNDNIDAVLIARCPAAATDIHEPPDARLAPLAQHLTMIEQLTEDKLVSRDLRRSPHPRAPCLQAHAVGPVIGGGVAWLKAGTRRHRRIRRILLRAVDNRGFLIQSNPCNHCFLPSQKRRASGNLLSAMFHSE